MKRFLIATCAVAMLAACGGGGSGSTETKKDSAAATTETGAKDITKDPAYEKGLALEAANDCATCHKIEEKLQGPSFTDIANKYAGTSDTIVSHLAGKIISGGSGVWGEIMMTPHPMLSKEDAEAIVNYIFLFKK
jgi:cytochrome c